MSEEVFFDRIDSWWTLQLRCRTWYDRLGEHASFCNLSYHWIASSYTVDDDLKGRPIQDTGRSYPAIWRDALSMRSCLSFSQNCFWRLSTWVKEQRGWVRSDLFEKNVIWGYRRDRLRYERSALLSGERNKSYDPRSPGVRNWTPYENSLAESEYGYLKFHHKLNYDSIWNRELASIVLNFQRGRWDRRFERLRVMRFPLMFSQNAKAETKSNSGSISEFVFPRSLWGISIAWN